VLGRFTDIVYDSAADFCGTLVSAKPKESKDGPSPKRRQPALLHKLKVVKREARRELRRTKNRGGDVLSAHKAFMRAVRAHHDLLKAISQNKNSRQAAVERRRFLRDPHRFAKRLLSPPVTGKPSFTKATADDYFREAYSDCDRSYSYQPPFDMPRPARPKHAFDIKFATLEEFSEICRQKSNGSAPGLNGIPYLLYKRCDQVRSLLERVWVERNIPSAFQVGRIRLLPKSSDTSHPKHMRPISVLSSEGRLFWTVFQKRLSQYMLDNGYINPQGFLEGVAGCVEHPTVQWEMLQHAKRKYQQITMAWLDLENAYGSMRHMLVQLR